MSPAEFLSFYGLLNFYLYTLAFVYSPSKNALYGKLRPDPRRPPLGRAPVATEPALDQGDQMGAHSEP